MSGTKYCRSCNRSLPFDSFYNNRALKDGKTTYCKACLQKYQRTGEPLSSSKRLAVAEERKEKLSEGYKWCNRCSTYKPLEGFYRDSARATGRATYCKPCANSIKDEYRKKRARPLYTAGKCSAKERGLIFDISFEFYVENIFHKPCVYCGDVVLTVGMDRVDNSLGYTEENVAPCCQICNRMKMAHSSEFFYDHLKKILNYSG